MSKLALAVEKAAAKGTVVTLGPLGRFVELDRLVDQAEGDGIVARWEFGQEVLARRVGKQLPKGLLNEIAEAIGKSHDEVNRRAAFAVLYPTRAELTHAVRNFRSWHEIVSNGLTVTPRLTPPVTPATLPAGTFNVLLADPPWQYDFAETDNRKIENQYPTLDVVEIAAYRDSAGVAIQSVIAEDAVLFLWATSPKLREALTVMDGWGFEYVTQAVWVKDKIGMGYWFRQQHETILVGRRGNVSPPGQDLRRSSVLNAPRRQHSAKPDEAYQRIEEMFPDGVRLEVFAREQRDGWSVFGNQIS
ncbi:MAG: MT-A70 family methyltransferase [Candidatus Limnocylindrales bacterium]